MLYNKEDVLKELNGLELSDDLSVKTFIDNKHLDLDVVITAENLIKYFESIEFDCTGGDGLREFYIIFEDKNITVQVQENEVELVDTLDL